jgi:uncharacterized membrane protein (UPF0127 family)
MKIIIFFLSILIILLVAFLMFIYLLPKTPIAEINGHIFSLYLAKTQDEQSVGLAKYNKINQNQGMLFLFQKADNYSFWMKDMQFPIDIIFIENNKVVDVFQNVPVSLNDNLPVYTTKTKANKVLEVNAGLAKKYGIKVGTEVRLAL